MLWACGARIGCAVYQLWVCHFGGKDVDRILLESDVWFNCFW